MNQAQVRAALGAAAAQQRYSTWNKYYSTVRFQFARTGAGPFTWTVAAGTELRAFGYGLGQDMGGVGFPSGTSPATLAETNLQQASATLAGEKVRIWGMSCLLTSDSDAFLAKLLFPNLSVQLSLNGDQTVFKLGTPEIIPGGGGFNGFGDSFIQQPPLPDTYVSRSGAMSNGLPHAGNFYPFPQPVIWSPQGETDSNLVVKIKAERAVSTTSTDRAGAAGVAAYTSPAATAGTLGTYVTLKVHFWSRQNAPRSVNM